MLNIDLKKDILEAVGIESYESSIIGKNTRKLVIHLQIESEVLKLTPNFEKMKCLNFGTDVKGVGVTCRGNETYS